MKLRGLWRANPISRQPVAHRARGRRRSGQPGLTLLEVLVTLAIMSVIAAIALPVFARARHEAQRSACLSNLHQAALAIRMYADDHEGAFPTYLADSESAARSHDPVYRHDHFCQAMRLIPGQVTWVSLVSNYSARPKASGLRQVENVVAPPLPAYRSLFVCPADKDRSARVATSYEFKLWLAEDRREAEVVSPSEMVMIWEQWAYHLPGLQSEYDRRAQMNVAFVDGHVRWLRLAETSSARFGSGPNMHGNTVGGDTPAHYDGIDVAD